MRFDDILTTLDPDISQNIMVCSSSQQLCMNWTMSRRTALGSTSENTLCSFPVSLSPPRPDPFEAFIIFSIRHEIRRIDLHKRDYSLLVPGLRNTIALDFHFNRSLLYWTDVVEDKIYRGKLSESGGMSTHELHTHPTHARKHYCYISNNRPDVLGKESHVLLICAWAAVMEV